MLKHFKMSFQKFQNSSKDQRRAQSSLQLVVIYCFVFILNTGPGHFAVVRFRIVGIGGNHFCNKMSLAKQVKHLQIIAF
jgi:hypothetical protein